MICLRNVVDNSYMPVVDKTVYPDCTIGGYVRSNAITGAYRQLMWFYDDDAELFELQCIVDTIRNAHPDATIDLFMPYIPNARMDRVKTTNQLFTLKTFARIINSMNFHRVRVSDPHSNVATALIDRVFVDDVPYDNLNHALKIKLGSSNPADQLNEALICYPDAGSAKRYNVPALHSVTCNKCRDFDTGKITSLELTDPAAVQGKTVFILDDICSYGGTFYLAAKALRNAGAKDVVLVVTHCENSILKGKLFDTSDEEKLISSVFTTNSIFRAAHPDIYVTKL